MIRPGNYNQQRATVLILVNLGKSWIMAEASLALVSVENPPTGKPSEADDTVRASDDVLDKWMAETNSRNLYKHTDIVDLLWKSGSGVDVN